MSIYYQDEAVTVLAGDCLAVMAELPAESVHAIVTDPPYGLGFMGREWDGLPPGEPWARECLRVLKPGGHMLAFGGSRTWHRLAAAIEDAGFEIRDSIAWLYGSGFPKSLDVSKAIDKAAGAEREVVGRYVSPEGTTGPRSRGFTGDVLGGGFSDVPGSALAPITAPATPDAARWQGWGTALKPAFEPIVVARKPLTGTVAGNVLAHGTGALNIDASRTEAGQDYADKCASVVGLGSNGDSSVYGEYDKPRADSTHAAGRWPTNVLLDDTQAAELDKQVPNASTNGPGRYTRDKADAHRDRSSYVIDRPAGERPGFGDSGGASRFFPTFRYEAKAPTEERPRVNGIAHPTVKPLDLMRWLVRLVTPPGGTVLDPFAGSGTTLEAALIEGFESIGIEREADYLPLIKARLAKPLEAVLDLGALT